jgi:hydrogenase maturation protease
VRRILVAGIGNIFLGDDAFGVEVARRLSSLDLPAGVRVVDFGIRGLDLAYALMEDYAAVILVDASPRGRAPGTLYELEPSPVDAAAAVVDPHAAVPHQILGLVRSMGGTLPPVRVVGCEPRTRPDDEPKMGLSPEVEGAIEPAIALVQDVIRELLHA